jgi:Mitochondrial carrier protein
MLISFLGIHFSFPFLVPAQPNSYERILEITRVAFLNCLFLFCFEIACSLRVPGELIKQRRQVSQYMYSFRAIVNLYKSGGILAFYQGFLPTILREVL